MPDSATRVIAIRHGETAWNAQLRLQGQIDIELNDTGRRQALRLAHALADTGIAALYASDLLRATQTAQPIAARCGVALDTDAGLRERNFGIFEGQRWVDLEGRWPEQARRWRERNGEFAPDGGETLTDFYARCVDSATRLAARHPGQTIALVAHGGVLDCLYRAATHAPLQAPRSWPLGNASINRLLYSSGGFTLVGWNDAMHLDAMAAQSENDAPAARSLS